MRLVGDELLRDGDGLLRVALAVLEDVAQRAALDAAGAVDLVERQVEALLPLRAVLRVRAGQRAADAEIDRFAIGLCGDERPRR